MCRLHFEAYYMWIASEWTAKTVADSWRTYEDVAVRCIVLIRSGQFCKMVLPVGISHSVWHHLHSATLVYMVTLS